MKLWHTLFIKLLSFGFIINCQAGIQSDPDSSKITTSSSRVFFHTPEIDKYKDEFKRYFIELSPIDTSVSWYFPFDVPNRKAFSEIQIISQFGTYRRSNYKGHIHSGIDIVPKQKKEKNSKVFPISNGVVCYVRIDPPFSTVVVKHQLISNEFIYTSYIHLKEINVKIGESVEYSTQIGSLYTYHEAWAFKGPYDHLHLEIRKNFDDYGCATFLCVNRNKLDEYFFDPLIFLRNMMNEKHQSY